MLAVTQVNGCRWCHYAHARIALTAGVSAAAAQPDGPGAGRFPQEEAVALAFAQHYAESADRPDRPRGGAWWTPTARRPPPTS